MALGAGGSAATVFVDVEGDLSKFRKDVAGAGDVAKKELGGGKFATAAKGAGLALGAGLVAGAAKGISDALEREQLEANFAGSVGLEVDSAELVALTDGARDLYRDAWGETYEDVLRAQQSSFAAFGDGFSTEELTGFTEESLAIAQAFGLDAQEVLSTAGTAFSSGLTADDPQEIFDAIVASAQQVPEALQGEILAAGTEYSQFFSDLGFGSEEAFGILVANAGDGAYGIDKAGDAIKEFTIRATDGSSATVETFEAIGLEADAMANAFLAGGDTAKEAFDQTIDGLLSIEDPAERANAAIALFGTPLEDLGTQDIPLFLEGLRDGQSALEGMDGAADELAETIGDTTAAKLESFKRRGLDVLAEFAANVLIPALEGVLPVVEGLISAFEVMPGPIQAVVAGGAAFTAGFLVMAGPIARATTALSGFFKLLSANPYVLIIAATIALVILIVKNWDSIKEAIGAAVEWITTKVSEAWNWIKETSSAIWNGIRDFFAQWWPLILGIFTGGIGLVIGLIVQNWDSIWAKTQEIWNAISGFLGGVLEGIGGFFTDYIINPVGAIIGFFESLPETARNAWNGLRDAIAGVIETIKGYLGDLASAADRALGPLDEIVGFGGSVIGGIGGFLGFDDGGVVPGPTGAPRLVLAHGGETFIPTHKRGMEGAAGGGGDTVVVNLHDATIRSEDDVVRLARMLEEETRRVRRSKGVRS